MDCTNQQYFKETILLLAISTISFMMYATVDTYFLHLRILTARDELVAIESEEIDPLKLERSTKKITELEVEVKSKQSAEQNALEKILQLEELVEKSKAKSPPKPVGGKTTPKQTPSSTGRTSVTPSRPAK